MSEQEMIEGLQQIADLHPETRRVVQSAIRRLKHPSRIVPASEVNPQIQLSDIKVLSADHIIEYPTEQELMICKMFEEQLRFREPRI